MPHDTAIFPTLVIPLYAAPAPAWEIARHGDIAHEDIKAAAAALPIDQPDFWQAILDAARVAQESCADPGHAMLQGAASLYAAMTRAGGRS